MFRPLVKMFSLLLFLVTLSGQAETLHMYAGAGLKAPVERLVEQFSSQTGHQVVVEYGGSGQILTRFTLSATGDLFLPGSAEYVDKLAAKGQVLAAHPIVLHTPVLVVRNDKAGDIVTIKQLANSSLKLGMGDPKAIALGVGGEKLLAASGFGPQLKEKIVVSTTTIKQLLIYLLKGDIDAAIIGRSDAVKNHHSLRMLPTPPGTPEEVVTVAVLKTTRHPQLAAQFADYLASPAGVNAFISQGFLPVTLP